MIFYEIASFHLLLYIISFFHAFLCREYYQSHIKRFRIIPLLNPDGF